MRTASFLGFGIASLSLVACGTDVAQDPPPTDPPVAKTTWWQDVAPIAATHCMSCHQDGGIAPFSLTNFSDAHDNAHRMLTQVQARTMPPFNASEDASCTPRFTWKDDPRLTADQIKTIENWVSDGAVEGTKAVIPAIPNTDLAGVTKTLKPVVPFTASGDRDQFICYVLDPKVPAGAWLTGLQVRPGNDKVVHHVVITELVPGAEHDAVVAAHGIGMPWDCSASQTPGSLTVSIWTPGNEAMQTPADLAVPILGGAKLVMNLHYHPAGIGNNAPDATSIDIRTSTQWPKKMYFVTAFGNATTAPTLLADPDDRSVTAPEFRIPANKADHVEHMRFTVPDFGPGLQNLTLYSSNPHMHLIGTHLSTRIERPSARGTDPQSECLSNGPWNFDWQRTYIYNTALDTLPSVKKDDVIDIKCHWDNTMANPFVQRALKDAHLVAPVDVSLGEGNSTDEMCLAIFGATIDAPPPPTTGRTTPMMDDLPMAALERMSRNN